jgi:glycosyltransferase involved in cell wall biosynthesis
VPAFNERERVGGVVERLPAWVDHVVVVDDASDDGTARAARDAGLRRAAVARRTHGARAPRVTVLRHAKNLGVGAAIVTGYRAALVAGADVVAVMAGDDQMDPDDLAAIVAPVLDGTSAYVKGNRFVHASRRRMPAARRLAGSVLSALTRVTTGLAIDDSQCGYTALSARAARALPLGDLWPRYGYPNDLLGMLAARGFAVGEVPVRAVYAGERSGIRPWHVAVVTFIIARRWQKTHAAAGGAVSRVDRATDELVRPAQCVAEIEATIELGRAEARSNVGIVAEELPEHPLAVEGAHRALLDNLVCLLARETRRDEREHDALAEEKTA